MQETTACVQGQPTLWRGWESCSQWLCRSWGMGGDSFTNENTPAWASIPAAHTRGGGWERQPEAAPSV